VKSTIRSLAKSVAYRAFPKQFGAGSTRGVLSRERYEMLQHAFMYTCFEKVPGDYFEFGISSGRSMIHAHRIRPYYQTEGGTRLIGFDSFQGFPEPTGLDKKLERFRKGEAACARDRFEQNLAVYGIRPSELTVFEGWFNETLSPANKASLSSKGARIVNIDCDLYESTTLALDFVTDLLQDGTVILFDDWLCFRASPDRGEQAATREWLQRNPRLRLVPYRPYANVGQSFIVSFVQ
jgi:O-methyltransferase